MNIHLYNEQNYYIGFNIQDNKNYPIGDKLSQYDILPYEDYSSSINPLFESTIMFKNPECRWCQFSKDYSDWAKQQMKTFKFEDRICKCKYHCYSLIVSVIINKEKQLKPEDSNFQIDFIDSVCNYETYQNIIKRDGTVQSTVFTIASTMYVYEENPYCNILQKVTSYQMPMIRIIVNYRNHWFNTFKGIYSPELYHRAFLMIVEDIRHNNLEIIEKKENPHITRKKQINNHTK